MKLFNLFKSEGTITRIPSESVLLILLEYMKEYQQNQLALKEVTNISTIKQKYEELSAAGLGNTANAKVLKSIIERSADYDNAQEFLKFCKRMKESFPKSFIISTTQFEKVVNDYHLGMDLLKYYKGVVPTDCAEYLMKCHNTLIHNTSGDRFNSDLVRVKKVDVSWRIKEQDYDKRFIKWLKEHKIVRGNIGYGSRFSYEYLCEYNSNVPKLSDDVKDQYGVFGDQVRSSEFLIAAPNECFVEDFEVTSQPIDPIVFQKCRYGIIVHAVWGDEADSEVLKRYKEFADNL